MINATSAHIFFLSLSHTLTTLNRRPREPSAFPNSAPRPPLPTATVREKEWDNIAAVHRGVAQVTTWSFDRQRMGEHRLLPARLEGRAGRSASATVRHGVGRTACAGRRGRTGSF